MEVEQVTTPLRNINAIHVVQVTAALIVDAISSGLIKHVQLGGKLA